CGQCAALSAVLCGLLAAIYACGYLQPMLCAALTAFSAASMYALLVGSVPSGCSLCPLRACSLCLRLRVCPLCCAL
ncbi:MAG: hypothetical protein K6A35_04475, partial [bacterium]|nr:hypothetical protein [bacterium]